MKKVIKTSFLVILMIMFLFTVTYGFTIDDLDGKVPNSNGIKDMKNLGASVLEIIAIIASAISIITIIALGIKYMMGSLEEKAQYKKTLLPYFIGAGMVFGATTIAEIVYKMFK